MTYSFVFRPAHRLLLALGLGSATHQAAAQDAPKEQLTVDLTAPDKPGSLEVKLVSGSLHVSGYGGKRIVVEAAGRPRPAGKPRAEKAAPPGMKRLATTSPLNLTAAEKNNHVELTADSFRQSIDLTIKVPLSFSLKLGTLDGGDIVVENVQGELEVSNVNGAIVLNQVSGPALANTVNGNLTVTFRKVTAGAPMAFSSLTGKVDVTLPATTKATLKLKSSYGQVYSDFDVALEKRAAPATRTGQQGPARLSTDAWTYGTLNGGGAEITLQTMNGDILLHKAK